MILIDAQGLRASRPGRTLFEDLSLTLSDGDRVGVVGLNGCGKSTLLAIMSGEREPEAGVVRRGRNARIGTLAQVPALPAGTVRNAVCDGLGPEAWRGEAALSRLGMGNLLDAATDELSGGQRKRVALGSLLAREWDALILDEPTNHLDLDAIAYLEQWLAAFSGGLLLVTHDRHVLDRVTTKVLEIDRGRGYLHVPTERAGGSGYAAYLAAQAEREAQAVTAEQTRRNLARRELAWLQRGAPARTSKPKARIDAAKALLAGGPQASAREGALGLDLGSARLGSKGIELHGVGFAWPTARTTGPDAAGGNLVLRPFSHSFEPGDRVGIVGPNGAGKSTLLDLIAGRRQPTAGSIEVGATVKIGYYDQLGRDLDLRQRVRDAVVEHRGGTDPARAAGTGAAALASASGPAGEPTIEDVKLMRRFWFDGDAQFAPIGTLSGGEQRRLQLLLTLIAQPNVLLLDEPTNDLDLDTLRVLEDFLDDWPGIVVVVSHDRAFLDRTVTEVLALDGAGGAAIAAGGVAGWLAERATQAGAPARRAAAAGSSSTTGAARPAPKPPKSRPASKRSPGKLRQLLEIAERKLADATEQRDAVQSELIGAGADRDALVRLSEQLAAAQQRVDAAEEYWLSLADEAESIGLSV